MTSGVTNTITNEVLVDVSRTSNDNEDIQTTINSPGEQTITSQGDPGDYYGATVLSETVESELTETPLHASTVNTEQHAHTVTETTEQNVPMRTVSETAEEHMHTVTETKEQNTPMRTVSKTAEEHTHTLTETTGLPMRTVSETADQHTRTSTEISVHRSTDDVYTPADNGIRQTDTDITTSAHIYPATSSKTDVYAPEDNTYTGQEYTDAITSKTVLVSEEPIFPASKYLFSSMKTHSNLFKLIS